MKSYSCACRYFYHNLFGFRELQKDVSKEHRMETHDRFRSELLQSKFDQN